MTEKLTYQRQLAMRHEPNVSVAGGVRAGVAAALAAVPLREAQSCLGGRATAGLVPAFMRRRPPAMGACLPNAPHPGAPHTP